MVIVKMAEEDFCEGTVLLSHGVLSCESRLDRARCRGVRRTISSIDI